MAYTSGNYFLLQFPFITLIIFLSIVLSNCDNNTNYAACSIPYSCGHIQNVGYPFWGDNRPKFCGIPDLKLSCDAKDNHTYPKIHVSQNGLHLGGDVLHINTSSHNMVVNQSMLEHCHVNESWNNKISSLTPLLKLDTGHSRSIQLFYGCSTSCVPRYQYTCQHFDGTNDTASYFGNHPADISRLSKLCSCKNNVSFPVDKRVLDELSSRRIASSSSFLDVLTKWPIHLDYIANFSACSKCEESGGSCGSPVDLSSNQFVCYCPGGSQSLPCPRVSDKKKNNLGVALGLGLGGAFILAANIAIWLCMKQKLGSLKFVNRCASIDCSSSELERGSVYFGVPLFSYRELVEATDNFDQSKELGNGGFGIVYYGKLKDGREVAVKRLYEKSYKRIEQFMNEVHILTRLRHHNLVSLYGCTSQHCRELLLVYEYVKNGTVADHLLSTNTNSQPSLSWPVRLRIAVETATALSYLHASDIIHRDVKTNNILLDSNFSVKVADFGLSRLFPTDVTHVSTAPQGTPGYLDPEYHQCYQLTDKSDVYSFGVVLIELISSLPAIDMNRDRNEINLSNYAIHRIQRCEFNDLVDPQLGFESDFKVRRMTISVAEVAFQCLQHDKELRPSMDEVLEVLKRIEDADYEALLLQGEDNLLSSPSPTEDCCISCFDDDK